MLDMIIRCGGREKTTFAFFNTGIEYRATLEHLVFLEHKYDIKIEKVRAARPIPVTVKEYGVPFLSKEISSNIYALQSKEFKWEDEPYDVLNKRYPHTKGALRWWCNYGRDTERASSRFMIKRHKYLKEFLMKNPPQFKISPKCCIYAKKNPSHRYEKDNGFDLKCMGIRKAEGGVRAVKYKNCFTETENIDQFRPVFWLRNTDMDEYCKHYGVVHSECYTKYGFKRTGCAGCPFNLAIEKDLSSVCEYEPEMYKLAHKVFGDSYKYTQAYYRFREEMESQGDK